MLDRNQSEEIAVEVGNQGQQQIATKVGSVDYSLLEPGSVNNTHEHAVDTGVSNQNEVQVRVDVNGSLGNKTRHSASLVQVQDSSDHSINDHTESNIASSSNEGGDILDVVESAIVFGEGGANLVSSDGIASGQLEHLIITDRCDDIVTFVRVKQEEVDANSPPFQTEYKAYIDCIFGGAGEQGNGELKQQHQVTEFQVIYRVSQIK